MRFFARLFLVCGVLVPALHAEGPSVTAPAAVAKAKPKRWKWLRRVCSGEVNLAMKLSSMGIEQSSAVRK